MACNCFGDCACALEAGYLINIVGSGDVADPYIISSAETTFAATNTGGGLTITPAGPFGHTPNIDLDLGSDPGLQITVDGLELLLDPASPIPLSLSAAGLSAASPVTVLDTNSIDLTLAGTQISADLRLDTNSGLQIGAGGVSIDLDATPGLQLAAGGLSILLPASSGLELVAGGLQVNLDANPGLQLGAGGISVDLGTNPALQITGTGLELLLDPASPIVLSKGVAGLSAALPAISSILSVSDTNSVDLTLALSTLSADVRLVATGGLETVAGGVQINLDTNPGLQTAAGGLSIDLDTNPALQLGAGGLSVLLAATPGLTTTGGLSVLLPASSGLELIAGGLRVDLDTNSGLQLAAAGMSIDLDTNPALQLAAGGISVLLGATPGLTKTGGLSVLLPASSGLELVAGGLQINLDTNPGLQLGAGGISIDLDTNPGLQLGAGGLSVDLDTNPGLVLGAGGLKVLVDPAVCNGLSLGAAGLFADSGPSVPTLGGAAPTRVTISSVSGGSSADSWTQTITNNESCSVLVHITGTADAAFTESGAATDINIDVAGRLQITSAHTFVGGGTIRSFRFVENIDDAGLAASEAMQMAGHLEGYVVLPAGGVLTVRAYALTTDRAGVTASAPTDGFIFSSPAVIVHKLKTTALNIGMGA